MGDTLRKMNNSLRWLRAPALTPISVKGKRRQVFNVISCCSNLFFNIILSVYQCVIVV